MRAIASAEARETTMLMGVVSCSGFYSISALNPSLDRQLDDLPSPAA
jgi:hypothetical protein